MNETQLITFVIEKACSTQKQVHGAFVTFFCDLKRILDKYLEERVEGVGTLNERRFNERMAYYKAMEEEAEQELEKIRQPKN
jgi:nucleoid DNA-binding protein